MQVMSNNLLIEFEDNRGWLRRIHDGCLAMARECQSRWQRRYNPLKEDMHRLFPSISPGSNSYNIDQSTWQKSSKLVVLIHGLNSSPLAWTDYLVSTGKSDSSISYFVPFVYKKGYCRCKEAAKPILEVVQTYAENHPDNPICLVGHSNGARIAAYIEQKVKAKKIHLVSIAGPHYGIRGINWLKRLCITRLFGISDELAEELTYQGDHVTKKLVKWKGQQSNANITRVFFASVDDLRIFPITTSFPDLPNSSYHWVSGESHVTIIDAVRDQVLSHLKT